MVGYLKSIVCKVKKFFAFSQRLKVNLIKTKSRDHETINSANRLFCGRQKKVQSLLKLVGIT